MGWVEIRTPTVWIAGNYAEWWYADALAEAKAEPSTLKELWGVRRREVIFATCFAESYLFEWVRDECLGRDYERVLEYFPLDKRRPLADRWKAVTLALFNDGLLSRRPDFSDRGWTEFLRLLRVRNGLIHGSASRPEVPAAPSYLESQQPVPTLKELALLGSGWATSTAAGQARRLHQLIGRAPPHWLEEV